MKLFSEARSIEKLEIVTMDGQVLATLLRRVTTDTVDYKLTYEAQINPDQQVAIPADTDVRVALRAVIRSVDNAGFADDLVQVRTFNITLRGVNTNNTANIPLDGPFPKHQTAFGRIVAVNRLSAATEPLTSGTGKILTSFSVTGSTVAGRTLSLTETTFSVIRTGSVTLTNWKLTARKSGASVACSMNPSANTVSCPQLTDTVGLMDPREPLTLDLSADTVVTGAGIIEISLPTAGSPEALGSIYWTDHSGTYRWIEGPTPVMTGTKFQ